MTEIAGVSGRIMDRETLAQAVRSWQANGDKVAFTNGVFDLLHLGHIDYLNKTAALGQRLVVGVNSDSSSRRLGKGPTRPIKDEISRAHLIAALRFVDAVCIFDEDTPFELISAIQPDVLAKGGDYTIDQIAGADVVQARGGTVHVIEFLPGYSTTALENKIKQS